MTQTPNITELPGFTPAMTGDERVALVNAYLAREDDGQHTAYAGMAQLRVHGWRAAHSGVGFLAVHLTTKQDTHRTHTEGAATYTPGHALPQPTPAEATTAASLIRHYGPCA